MKKAMLGLFTILSLILLVSCNEKKISGKIVRINIEQNPAQLDPQLNTDKISGNIIGNIFEGLTELDEKGKIMPAVAESWKNSGNIWTFKLRKNAKWQNGDAVVAKDFIDGWERVLNPESNSKYSYILYLIKGAQEYNEGKIKDFTTVGIKAIDDFTLVVELKEPTSYFPLLVSYNIFMPENKKYFESHREKYGNSEDDILGNGSYKIISWEKNNKIILKKYDKYWNKDNVKIDGIEMFMINDEAKALEAYTNNKLDWTEISPNEVLKNKVLKEKISWEEGTLWFLLLNNKDKLFSNKKIRKAISLGINRESLVNDVKSKMGVEAKSIIPDTIYGKKGFFREDYNSKQYGIEYNPIKAKELFDEGLKELGMNNSEITINLLCENKGSIKEEAEFYKEQLKNVLGINVQVKSVTHQIKLQKISSKDFEISLEKLEPNYNDPMAYLNLWKSNSIENNSSWSNLKYDEFISKAKIELDLNKRMDNLFNAELILMDELPIIPTYFIQKSALIKPNLKNVIKKALNPSMDLKYLDI